MTNPRTRIRGRFLSGAVAVAIVLVYAAAPAGAAPSGTVDATVTVEGACITVPSSPLDFGALGFSVADANTEGSTLLASVASCTTQAMDLYARASDATGDGTGFWTLGYDGTGLVCSLGQDQFGAGIRGSLDLNTTWLTTLDLLVRKGVDSSSPFWFNAHVMMPCSGSSGVGETMTFTYTFTATLP